MNANAILIKIAALSSQRTMIVSLACTLLFWLFFFDNGDKLKSEKTNLESSIKQVEVEANRAQQALKEVEDLKRLVSSLGEQFKMATQQLPTEIPMTEMIKTVDILARSANVSIKSKQPENAEQKDILEVIPLKVGAECSYTECLTLIYYLSITERIVRIGDFQIRSPTEGPIRKLAMNIQIISYRFIGVNKGAGGQK